jgi:uncharacterized protein
MSEGASKLRDLKQLSDTGAAFEYELELAQLPGVPLYRGAGAGTVRARVRFGREHGWPAAQVALAAEVEMTCQRCMRPVRVPIDVDSPVLIVDSEQAAERVPEGSETFLAADGRLSIAALVAEELMLALPIVPMHESSAQCLASAPDAAPGDEAALEPRPAGDGGGDGVGEVHPVTRPFADLRAMMDKSK